MLEVGNRLLYSLRDAYSNTALEYRIQKSAAELSQLKEFWGLIRELYSEHRWTWNLDIATSNIGL